MTEKKPDLLEAAKGALEVLGLTAHCDGEAARKLRAAIAAEPEKREAVRELMETVYANTRHYSGKKTCIKCGLTQGNDHHDYCSLGKALARCREAGL